MKKLKMFDCVLENSVSVKCYGLNVKNEPLVSLFEVQKAINDLKEKSALCEEFCQSASFSHELHIAYRKNRDLEERLKEKTRLLTNAKAKIRRLEKNNNREQQNERS